MKHYGGAEAMFAEAYFEAREEGCSPREAADRASLIVLEIEESKPFGDLPEGRSLREGAKRLRHEVQLAIIAAGSTELLIQVLKLVFEGFFGQAPHQVSLGADAPRPSRVLMRRLLVEIQYLERPESID